MIHTQLTLKVKFWHFLTPLNYTNSQNSISSFGYVDYYAKNILILYSRTWNSITGIAILLIHVRRTPQPRSAYWVYIKSHFTSNVCFHFFRLLKKRGIDKDRQKELKQERRTLKNRGYAANCRVKRETEEKTLEKRNDKLKLVIF